MKFKEYVQKAVEIRDTSAAWYRERAEVARKEIAKARTDLDLSPEGRMKKAAKLKFEYGEELLKAALERKQQYIDLLKQAKADAEATLKRGIPKPSDDKIADFQKVLNHLKVEIMLSTNFDTVAKKIEDVMKTIDEPYLATMLADEFATIVPQALAVSTDPSKAKTVLSDLFERLNNEYLPEDVKEARQSLEFINASLENPKLFAPIVEANAVDVFGNDVGKKLNTPEVYFEQ
ncbi:hypothetical protein [Geobacillus thermodenitrificans]|uniref:hypothetical protein n=1 Tax=Geobacillus thermodenitrificans TaxID=33940 RepID=UPI002E1AC564|nr:hypothetical protein [Geobacillus thermodenitrificans]